MSKPGGSQSFFHQAAFTQNALAKRPPPPWPLAGNRPLPATGPLGHDPGQDANLGAAAPNFYQGGAIVLDNMSIWDIVCPLLFARTIMHLNRIDIMSIIVIATVINGGELGRR